MRFESILVMGSNKVACDCVVLLSGTVPCDQICVIETSDSLISMLKNTCMKRGISYQRIVDNKSIGNALCALIKSRKTLVISANNRYIFKRNEINRSNVEIINFHYGLLPGYRGMNIPSWVIYNGEKETGVTWHYVTEKIDHGDVIDQRIIEITDRSTAYEIVKTGMRLGKESFESFYKILLDTQIKGTECDFSKNPKVYKFSELPNNGIVSLDSPIDNICRLLRAYDYAESYLFPKLVLSFHGKKYRVEKYCIEQMDADLEAESDGVLIKDDKTIIVKGEKKIITISVSEACDY